MTTHQAPIAGDNLADDEEYFWQDVEDGSLGEVDPFDVEALPWSPPRGVADPRARVVVPPTAADAAGSAFRLPFDLGQDAYQGLAGEAVKAILPHTEADPAALLVTYLAAAGVMMPIGWYMRAGDKRHHPRVWPLIIGKTAGGMKGTSLGPIERIMKRADKDFHTNNVQGGLSSGEGLIEHVRDPVGTDPSDKKNFIEGVEDKRLFLKEPEFAGVLKQGQRDGNILGEILRQAWDGGRLQSMARQRNKLTATDPQITIVGHISPTDLKDKLTASDVAGGLMNRFLPVCSHRSKRKPDGGSTPDWVIERLGDDLAARISDRARCVGPVTRNAAADRLWHAGYEKLTPDDLPDDVYASIVARAAPQVLRLALIYALLDTHELDHVEIRPEHHRAALAVWEYVTTSAQFVFGDLSTNSALNKVMAEIEKAGPAGITRTALNNIFSGKKTEKELDALAAQLVAAGRYKEETKETGGRPITRYRQVTGADLALVPQAEEGGKS